MLLLTSTQFRATAESCRVKGALTQAQSAKGRTQAWICKNLSFYSCFYHASYPLFCKFSEEMRSLLMKQFYIFDEKCFKNTCKECSSSTLGECEGWWKYTKNLTSFVFELLLKFSSVQENPLNWKLAYITMIIFKKNTIIWPLFDLK